MLDQYSETFLGHLHDVTKRYPDRLALIDPTRELSFQELDSLTDQYSRFLSDHAHALGKQSIAPIVADRNVETVVWMIACVKAGVPFLNINCEAPAVHIQKLLGQLESGLCIATAHQAELGRTASDPAMVVDSESVKTLMAADARHQSSASVAWPSRHPETPMYAVSTSGTTGEPKIILIPHRAFMNYSNFVRKTHELRENSGMAICQLAPNFDVFIKETLIPLQAGVTVRLLSNEEKYDSMRLADILNRMSSWWLHTTYTFYQTLQSQLTANRVNHLIFVGEPLGPLAESTFTLAKNVWNEYGPAETTIGITLSRVLPGEPVSIGKAIDNNEVLVLDRNGDQELASSEVGELTVIGRNVGLGYLHATANAKYGKRAITRLNGEVIEVYCYRTGDIAYKDEQGDIYFNGRADRQVKIRGQWVHLQELETLIADRFAVQDTKIYYHEIFAGAASLVAYIKTSESDIELLGKHIRSELGRQLNYYEIPEYFIPVKAYPYGMNDKLNEQELQNWCREFLNRSQFKAPVDAPLSATETQLITLWQVTLGHENFGATDSFFDVGGNSLLCHQLILNMYDEGYSGITVKDLYEGATVKQLARRIDQTNAHEEMSHAS